MILAVTRTKGTRVCPGSEIQVPLIPFPCKPVSYHTNPLVLRIRHRNRHIETVRNKSLITSSLQFINKNLTRPYTLLTIGGKGQFMGTPSGIPKHHMTGSVAMGVFEKLFTHSV
jgi:hypothetical protein